MERRKTFKKEKEELKIKQELSEDDIHLSKTNSVETVQVKEEVDVKEDSVEEQFIEISTNSAYKMDLSSNEKSKALSKDETRGLLNLILKHPIITSRETNATFNHQKILEWNQITEDFNSTYSMYPRTTKQLRLKWENMKKNARKRNAKKRANRGKTETAEYIPRDDILDKVFTLLRQRPSDKASTASHDDDDDDESDDSGEDTPVKRENEASQTPSETRENCYEAPEQQPSAVSESNVSHMNGFSEQPPRKKKKKRDEGRESRNRAMACYYEAKTKLIDANLINIKLQNEKLRLEIEILKRNKI